MLKTIFFLGEDFAPFLLLKSFVRKFGAFLGCLLLLLGLPISVIGLEANGSAGLLSGSGCSITSRQPVDTKDFPEKSFELILVLTLEPTRKALAIMASS